MDLSLLLNWSSQISIILERLFFWHLALISWHHIQETPISSENTFFNIEFFNDSYSIFPFFSGLTLTWLTELSFVGCKLFHADTSPFNHALRLSYKLFKNFSFSLPDCECVCVHSWKWTLTWRSLKWYVPTLN